MEIQFQQHNHHHNGSSIPVISKFKGRSRASGNTKFVGVRQRPSGRWVAEIKDTTQKIRMWLGTFETAEEAARAYDEAACLLRGSNTRTNFISTHVSPNSPLAFRIRNLLNSKKGAKKQSSSTVAASSTPTVTAAAAAAAASNNIIIPSSIASTSSCSASTGEVTSSGGTDHSASSGKVQDSLMFDDAYRPDLSEFELGSSSQSVVSSWGFGPGYDHRFPNNQELVDLPRINAVVPPYTSELAELSEFDRMKVERQISASLYAMNGVQEYMETLHDPTEAFWDLPPLCSLFC